MQMILVAGGWVHHSIPQLHMYTHTNTHIHDIVYICINSLISYYYFHCPQNFIFLRSLFPFSTAILIFMNIKCDFSDSKDLWQILNWSLMKILPWQYMFLSKKLGSSLTSISATNDSLYNFARFYDFLLLIKHI